MALNAAAGAFLNHKSYEEFEIYFDGRTMPFDFLRFGQENNIPDEEAIIMMA